MSARIRLFVFLILLAGPLVNLPMKAQVRPSVSTHPPKPLPDGQRLDASDGDTISIDDDARVRVVRRRKAVVRVIYNAEQRWAVVIVDYEKAGEAADGRVDAHYTFYDVDGRWPLPLRWQGPAVLEDYLLVGEGPGTIGLGLRLDGGLVQFANNDPLNAFTDASAHALRYRGSSRGVETGLFDDMEQRRIAEAAQNAENRAQGSNSVISHSPPAGLPATVASRMELSTSAPQTSAVRVGSTIATPQKLVDVPPVYPRQARQARITGTVLLELTVGADGAVTNARVLRSIPRLDAAAIDAARQWRYAPTLVNGEPVPIILTATVKFP
jgi:TonB family protein